jgi:prepilin-type N-terminal cleavage/methylation domain-containing protein
MKNLRSQKGFTLIEMLVVVVIIAILVAISIPALFRSVIDARTRACAGNIRNIESAAALFASQNNGVYPEEAPHNLGIAAFVGQLAFFPDGPPTCPWGRAYAWDPNGVGIVDKGHFQGAGGWPTDH